MIKENSIYKPHRVPVEIEVKKSSENKITEHQFPFFNFSPMKNLGWKINANLFSVIQYSILNYFLLDYLYCDVKKMFFFNNLVIFFFQLLKTLLQHLRLSLQQMYISLQRAPKLIHKIVSGTPWLLSYAYTVFSTSLGYKLLKKI